LYVLHGYGEDAGREQMRWNRFMDGLKVGPRTGSGAGRPGGSGGGITRNNVDEEMIVGIELEEVICKVNEDEDNRATAAELEEIRCFKTTFDSTF